MLKPNHDAPGTSRQRPGPGSRRLSGSRRLVARSSARFARSLPGVRRLTGLLGASCRQAALGQPTLSR